jgi:hypothetical protein
MRFFIALFLLIVMIFIGIQSYKLYQQEADLSIKKSELDAQASALIVENKKFENDIQYFQNDLNLTKELQSKAGYRKPDEKMFMLLPAQ